MELCPDAPVAAFAGEFFLGNAERSRGYPIGRQLRGDLVQPEQWGGVG
jgi:hypothetical protein